MWSEGVDALSYLTKDCVINLGEVFVLAMSGLLPGTSLTVALVKASGSTSVSCLLSMLSLFVLVTDRDFLKVDVTSYDVLVNIEVL